MFIPNFISRFLILSGGEELKGVAFLPGGQVGNRTVVRACIKCNIGRSFVVDIYDFI